MAQPTKKLIEYGWDVPDPAYVREHVRDMEKRPFDGVMMRLACGAGQVFSTRRVGEKKAAPDLQALRGIPWHKFTDNFVVTYARGASGDPAPMDWFSDSDWKTVAANVSLCARAARMGGCKGLAFNAEPAGRKGNCWNYAIQAHAKDKSFQEYEAQVRKRGAQFIRAITEEMPDARILTFFQLSVMAKALDEPDPVKRQTVLAGHFYGLLPAFLNGMLDAAGPKIILIDGNEPSYTYASALDFYKAYHLMRRGALALVAPENAGKYEAQVQAGQALYVDYVFATKYWWEHKGLARYLTPQDRARWFEHNVYYALASSDEYTWLYSEQMNWWKNENLPPGLVEAVASAREKLAAGKPLWFDVGEMIREAQTRLKKAP